MSADSSLQGSGGQTVEQRLANLEAALRGGPPVIGAQGQLAGGAVNLGSAMNPWDRVYAETLILGGEEFPLLNMLRNIQGTLATWDYVFGLVPADDLDSNAVIWLDGSTTGDIDVAALVPDEALRFRLLRLTSAVIVSDDFGRRIAGISMAVGHVASGDDGFRSVERAGSTLIGTGGDLPAGVQDSAVQGGGTMINVPSDSSNILTRGAGESFVVTIGEPQAYTTVGAVYANTRSSVTIDGTEVFGYQVGAMSSGDNLKPDDTAGTCLLVPIYP